MYTYTHNFLHKLFELFLKHDTMSHLSPEYPTGHLHNSFTQIPVPQLHVAGSLSAPTVNVNTESSIADAC